MPCSKCSKSPSVYTTADGKALCSACMVPQADPPKAPPIKTQKVVVTDDSPVVTGMSLIGSASLSPQPAAPEKTPREILDVLEEDEHNVALDFKTFKQAIDARGINIQCGACLGSSLSVKGTPCRICLMRLQHKIREELAPKVPEIRHYPSPQAALEALVPERRDGPEERRDAFRPKHYGGPDDPFECRKVIAAWGSSWEIGSALKHLCRVGKKPGESALSDLKKAATYIQFEIERREGPKLKDPLAGYIKPKPTDSGVPVTKHDLDQLRAETSGKIALAGFPKRSG